MAGPYLSALAFAVLGQAVSSASANSCPVGRPCITAVYNQRANLVLEWNDTEERDRYNVRWSRPGKDAVQVEMPGGSRGQFSVKNFRPDTPYTFAVQGCRKPTIGRSRCTEWVQQTATSCGAKSSPCRP